MVTNTNTFDIITNSSIHFFLLIDVDAVAVAADADVDIFNTIIIITNCMIAFILVNLLQG